MAKKYKDEAMREYDQLVEAVYSRWEDPGGTKRAVQRTLMKDWSNPDRMAIWRIAASSKSWRIE